MVAIRVAAWYNHGTMKKIGKEFAVVWAVCMAALATVAAGADEVSKWDSRMAAEKATVDTNGVKWIDGRYLPKTDMYNGDLEGTIDGCHPNDWGSHTMALAYGKAVREALKLTAR